MVLSWYEELTREEQPPRHIWWSADLLEEWFEDVRAKRRGSTASTSYAKSEDVPMTQNELVDRNSILGVN
jgi:hypothetical protein